MRCLHAETPDPRRLMTDVCVMFNASDAYMREYRL